jgi:hypothetical protein
MASTALTGKVAVIGGSAKNLGGLISRAFGALGDRICPPAHAHPGGRLTVSPARR